MKIEKLIQTGVIAALKKLYDFEPDNNLVQLQNTRKDFIGDITLVVFPVLKYSKKRPEDTAAEIGNYLEENIDEVKSYNVVKGFLNLEINDK